MGGPDKRQKSWRVPTLLSFYGLAITSLLALVPPAIYWLRSAAQLIVVTIFGLFLLIIVIVTALALVRPDTLNRSE
jgi:hypothetical protein